MIGQRYRRLVSSIAIFAVLLLTFAPTVTHALMAKSSAPWQELCTAQGLKLADASGNQSAPQPDAQHGSTCPFCGAHSHHVVVLDGASSVVTFPDSVVMAEFNYQSPAITNLPQFSHPAQGPPVI